jgi:AraC-like DNA-binding protein
MPSLTGSPTKGSSSATSLSMPRCGVTLTGFRSDPRNVIFSGAVGITQRTVRQIERARYATHLLKQGVSILDTVHEAGYFDQAHLTRSLKTLIGQTPVEIARNKQQLSFLYKTTLLPALYDAHGRFAHDRIGTTRCAR